MTQRTLSSLQSLSKDELIGLILRSETKTVGASRKRRTEARPFDPTGFASRHVALKVAYFGWRYHGFASQTGLANLASGRDQQNVAETVEDCIFRALLRTRLILDPATCGYSRCGRTDAGVSATGQVIALRLRASPRREAPAESMDYARMLNKQLPDDIRILDWAVVSDAFSARFSCSARLYHYYFPAVIGHPVRHDISTLDIDGMQQAARLLVGVHDFRNFCKRDPSKPNQSHVREIYESRIEAVRGGEFYRFVCKGSAFLYHQVRCMMAVLLMVGRGEEPVELVSELLTRLERRERREMIREADGETDGVAAKNDDTTDKTTRSAGPVIHYEIAPETPLVLHSCFYERSEGEGVSWSESGDSSGFTAAHIHRLWQARQGEALVIKGLLDGCPPTNANAVETGRLLEKLREAAK